MCKTVVYLRSFNTFGCILKIGDLHLRKIANLDPHKRGADVPLARRASQADSGPRIGPMSLPCTASATFAKGEFNV